MNFLHPGHSERFKLYWHLGIGVGLLGALAYNLAAFAKRREHHLAVNSAVYGAGVVIEALQIRRHWEAQK